MPTLKPAPTTQPLADNIQQRWSPRAFDPARAISEDSLTALMEAAHWAPSCMNEQPWRYLLADKHRHPDSWQRLLGCLVEKNQLWAQQAPLLILAASVTHFNNSDKTNPWAAYDTGASAQNLALQATALGLVTHSMGGFDKTKLQQQFALPADIIPWAVIAVGYQASADSLNDEFRQKELAERQRSALASRFYLGSWPG